MNKFNLFRYFFILLIVIFATGVFAMSVSDIGKVCLFSSISGVITLNGKPAAGAKLIRTADRDGVKTDETVTDKNGFFEFPAMFERTITKHLPMEFVASQKIVAHYDGKEYKIWSGVKRKKEENVESRGKPLVVSCELNSEIKYIDIGATFIHSLCIWDVISDQPTNWEKTGFFDENVKTPEEK
jgi:hypothetical protein